VYLAPRAMSRVIKSHPSIVVVLKLPEDNVPLLVTRAQFIVDRMTKSPWFPEASPLLRAAQGAIDDLHAAEVRTHTRAPDSVPDRDAKRGVLSQRLDELRSYVSKICNANPDHAAEIVESAGMYLKQLRGPAPRVFALGRGDHSGEVKVTFPRAGDRAAYEPQYSLDGGKTWLPFPQPVTNYATATLRGQTPGSTVHVRFRATVKGVTGDWSDPLAIIVD
jgi:hypothetical protein